MSAAAPVGVLLVTHGRLGRFFLDTLGDMLGDLSLPVEVLEVRRVQDTELLTRDGQRMIERLDTGSGVLVDCALTSEMLNSIFFPNSPMHDGGVVVRGDRIMYAACIFPLTRRIDINNSLGTRHRAAIGLSEETDAIVVLVSEETGDIAYCHNGALHRQVSLKQLKDFLVDQLKSDVPSKKPDSTPLQRLRDSLRAVLDLIEKKLRPDPR